MRSLIAIVSAAVVLTTAPLCAAAQTVAVDPELLRQMQETISQQQLQLKQQAEQIKAQSEVLLKLQQQINAIQQTTPTSNKPAALTPATQTTATTMQTAPPVQVASGNDKVKLAISGQINRALLIADDGYNTTTYQVDNNVSNSRVRFVGTAQFNNDLTLGTRIEFAIAPDVSSQVSQTTKSSGDYFDQRWVELSFDSKTFGKLSIGKGDTASNTTAEIDLSKTDVIQYASITDMGGGLLFRNRYGTKALTTLKVSDAFKSGDGLTRQSRLRYDSPTWYGFRLAGSLVSNQRSDIALFWGGEGYGFRGAGAFAVSNPKEAGARLLYDGSFSLLHTATGLNLTVSGALLDKVAPKDRTNLYAKLGWITNFTKLGYTAFGVDYTRSEHVAAAGDKGYSVGGAIVQSLEKLSAELYLQYRIYSLNRESGSPLADITIGTFGARVKF